MSSFLSTKKLRIKNNKQNGNDGAMLQLGDLDDHDPYKAALDDDQVTLLKNVVALYFLEVTFCSCKDTSYSLPTRRRIQSSLYPLRRRRKMKKAKMGTTLRVHKETLTRNQVRNPTQRMKMTAILRHRKSPRSQRGLARETRPGRRSRSAVKISLRGTRPLPNGIDIYLDRHVDAVIRAGTSLVGNGSSNEAPNSRTPHALAVGPITHPISAPSHQWGADRQNHRPRSEPRRIRTLQKERAQPLCSFHRRSELR